VIIARFFLKGIIFRSLRLGPPPSPLEPALNAIAFPALTTGPTDNDHCKHPRFPKFGTSYRRKCKEEAKSFRKFKAAVDARAPEHLARVREN
jgi:hypothetical protein